MPCHLEKNLSDIEKEGCKLSIPLVGLDTCEEMGEYECKQFTSCCKWTISGWDIFLIVFASIILLLGLIILVWYIYRKYYLK